MPRTNSMLGVLVLCFVTPWSVAESTSQINNENSGVDSTTTALNVDSTRKQDSLLHLTDLNTIILPTIENKIDEKNFTEKLIARTFESPIEELTSLSTEVPCDNAQFLLNILSAMLPLLKNEIPVSTRTSYILNVLKDLLKSSPEAAQDLEIMYKINDLLETLQKFHDKDRYPLVESSNALRTLNVAEKTPDIVKSKVVFKYEVPHLANPDCTAELLTIVKIVQQAILKLVNNPLCKSHIQVETPILVDVKDFFTNPNLYSYDNGMQVKNLPLLPETDQDLKIFNIDIPEDTDTDGKYIYHAKLPYHEIQERLSYPKVPKTEPFYIYPENSNANSIDYSQSYDISPDILSIINGDADKLVHEHLNPEQSNHFPYIYEEPYSIKPSFVDTKLPIVEKEIFVQTPISPFEIPVEAISNHPYTNPNDYLTKIEDMPKNHHSKYENNPIYSNLDLDYTLPLKNEGIRDYEIHFENSSPSPFSVYGDGSGELEFDKKKPFSTHELDLPLNLQGFKKSRIEPQDLKNYDYDLEFQDVQRPSIDIYGDDDSAEIHIGANKPKQINNKPKPELFGIDGSPDNAYIPLHQYPNNPDLYVVYPEENVKDNPNKYDAASQNLPTKKGIPYLPKKYQKPSYPYFPSDNSPKPSFNPNLLINPPNQNPHKSYPHNPYFPSSNPLTFDVTGDGSGEFQLGPTESPTTDYLELYVPQKSQPKQPDYPYDNIKPYYLHENKNPKFEPEYFWPENDRDENLVNLEVETPSSIDTPDQESVIIFEPTTKHPSRLDLENQYVIPETPDSNDFSIDFNVPENNEPNLLNPSIIPNLPQPNLVPDGTILLIIKDNIDVMEHKIPKEHLNVEIREMIINLKDLLNSTQITVEEYVNIINQYQILIEYVKHLNISNAILKELLLSMTNLDKLNLLTGKSQVIELTYLIKRPKPMIYQPYYYIKYQLPYSSFLTRVERLLELKPYLKKNPAKLYKALISISKISETSPDLEKYDTEDIFKLTFNKGTLVGAKVIKVSDDDLYNDLNSLKNVNSDLSIEDVYELIKNLDTQLKGTSEGSVLENSNIHTLNINTRPGEIRIVKLKKQPLLEKVTKITTNKAAPDQILAEIFHKVIPLRSNNSGNQTEEESNPSVGSDKNNKTNKTDHVIGRTRHTYELNDELSDDIPLVRYEPINYNIKAYATTNDNLKLPNDFNYYTNNNAAKSYYWPDTKNSNIGFNFNKLFQNPQYDKRSSLNQADWLDETTIAIIKKPSTHNSQSNDFDSIPFKTSKSNPYLADKSTIIDSGIYPKPLHQQIDNSLKDDTNNKQDDYASQKYYFESAPESVSSSAIIANPDTVKSQLIKHSKSYKNGAPLKHSKTYLIEKPYDELQKLEMSYTDPVKYKVENSQSFIDYDPNVANANYRHNSNKSEDISLSKESQASNGDSANYDAVKDPETYTNDNNNDDYNLANKHSQFQEIYQNLGNKPSQSQNRYHDIGDKNSQSQDNYYKLTDKNSQSQYGYHKLADKNRQTHDGYYDLGPENSQSQYNYYNLADKNRQSHDGYNDLGHENSQSQYNLYNLADKNSLPQNGYHNLAYNLIQSQDGYHNLPNKLSQSQNDYYNLAKDLANKNSQSQDLNSLQQYQSYNRDNLYNLAQNPTYNSDNQYAHNQNLANNILNARYRYLMHQRWPLLYQLNKRPRVFNRPFLG